MPNWKKVITSGSDAEVKSLYVSNAVTASDVSISEWGSVSASLSTLSEPNVKLFANETIADANDVYDYVNPISASIASDIANINSTSTSGTVTSVGGTGTISGLTLSGTVTTSGNLTLGGAISIGSSNITDVDAFSQSGTYASLRAQATTAADVGLGNVTNESKATMFTSPTFTGTVAGVTKSHVGLGNVENTAISTFAGSSNITTIGTIANGDVTAILPSGVISGSAQLGIDDTDDVSEGSTNLYYTDTRVKSKLNTEGVISGSSQVTIGSTSGYTTFSSSIASDIASIDVDVSSKPSKTAASGSRIGVWSNADTIRGYDSLHYFDNGGADIGIRLNPSLSTGRTIRMAHLGGTTGAAGLITRTPGTTLGATINYVVYNSTTNRTAGRIGQEISTWDQSGGNITGTGFTSFQYGSLPADLEVSVILSSGEMYLTMTWTGGGTYYCSANIDTFGPGI